MEKYVVEPGGPGFMASYTRPIARESVVPPREAQMESGEWCKECGEKMEKCGCE